MAPKSNGSGSNFYHVHSFRIDYWSFILFYPRGFAFLPLSLFSFQWDNKIWQANVLEQYTLSAAFTLDMFGVLAFLNIGTFLKERALFNRESSAGSFHFFHFFLFFYFSPSPKPTPLFFRIQDFITRVPITCPDF